jgi:hypothetical protein
MSIPNARTKISYPNCQKRKCQAPVARTKFQNKLPKTKIFLKQYHCNHTKKNEKPRYKITGTDFNEIPEQVADCWGIIQFAEIEDHNADRGKSKKVHKTQTEVKAVGEHTVGGFISKA